MKSKLFSILAYLTFALGGIQLVWLTLAIVISALQHPGSTGLSATGAAFIPEPHSLAATIVLNSLPYALLCMLFGLGFYFRWLGRRFAL